MFRNALIESLERADALDGDVPLEALVSGQEDPAHAATPEQALQPVEAELLGVPGRWGRRLTRETRARGGITASQDTAKP